MEDSSGTYLGVLIRSLLPFFRHRFRGSIGKLADSEKQCGGNKKVFRRLGHYGEAFTLWRLGPGTMGTKCNPIGCYTQQAQLATIRPAIISFIESSEKDE